LARLKQKRPVNPAVLFARRWEAIERGPRHPSGKAIPGRIETFALVRDQSLSFQAKSRKRSTKKFLAALCLGCLLMEALARVARPALNGNYTTSNYTTNFDGPGSVTEFATTMASAGAAAGFSAGTIG
jgi:hypothetical protein